MLNVWMQKPQRIKTLWPLDDWAGLKGPQLRQKLFEKMANSEEDRERFWSRVRKGKPDECWLWESCVDKDGYGLCSCILKTGIRKRTLKAHRVSYYLEYRTIPEGLCVCHKCDTPRCVNPFHLFLGTHADNRHDMDAKGRGNPHSGNTHWQSKLTENQVHEIRFLRHIKKLSLKEIADFFGITYSNVGQIARGTAWKHLPFSKETLDALQTSRASKTRYRAPSQK